MNNTITTSTQILDTMFNRTYIITSVTEKRVNLDEPNCTYTTSTGRSSSKFFVGHKSFNDYIETGRWVLVN
jgi:hypothetical protein